MQRSELGIPDLLQWQQEQFGHDQRNHTDIICLHRVDRLKHYALHYAKYAGRIARAHGEANVLQRTTVDTALVCLSAANALSQRLDQALLSRPFTQIYRNDVLSDIADAGGRFSDACEKIDHLEEFLAYAREANVDVAHWVFAASAELRIDLQSELATRREQLAARQFYIP